MSIKSAAKCKIGAIIQKFLEHYELDGENFVNSIVTIGET